MALSGRGSGKDALRHVQTLLSDGALENIEFVVGVYLRTTFSILGHSSHPGNWCSIPVRVLNILSLLSLLIHICY